MRAEEGCIEIKGVITGAVNLAMQQNYVPVIKQLILTYSGEEALTDLTVRITAEPAFAKPWSGSASMLTAEQPLEITGIRMVLSTEFFAGLTERMEGTVTIQVLQGEDLIAEELCPVSLLACDQWSGTLIMPELAAAFVVPNHPGISDTVKLASQYLEQWDKTTFCGYQAQNPNQVRMQMGALYEALKQRELAYCMPPASFEAIGQRVRLPDEVFSSGLGTCLDLAFLYAGCLEAVGLNALLIFIHGHAFAGCWMEDQCFPECLQDDVSLLTKRTADGIHEICLVECTGFLKNKALPFDDAVRAADRNLIDPEQFEFFLDLKRIRGSGIRPLPLRRVRTDGSFYIEESEPERKEAAAPEKIELFGKLAYSDAIEVSRLKMWERKLLDLSLRNTLINFRVSKSALQLMAGNLGALEDELAKGTEFQILPWPKEFEKTLRDSKIYETEHNKTLLESLADMEFANKRLRSYLDESAVAGAVTGLYRSARASLEENGTNTLYIALGFLRWYESDVSERARYAPLVLVPVEIVRKSALKGYVIRGRDEESQMNVTLLEMLRQDFGIGISGLDPLPADESGVALKRVFSVIRQAVMGRKRWDIEELAFLGLFSFSQFIMWNDIRNRSEELKKNKVVKSLISGRMEWESAGAFPEPKELDRLLKPGETAVPLSADSSQLAAVCASGRGESFILHGPPGTGKSQTITNMIANALYQGKSVLFIAEKMAALSVVQKRLASLGIGDFCLELHSNKAKKKDVLSRLDSVLQYGRVKSPEEYRTAAEKLYRQRTELNEAVEALHKKREIGRSLFEMITLYEQNRNAPDGIRVSGGEAAALSKEQFEQQIWALRELTAAGNETGGVFGHPLREVRGALTRTARERFQSQTEEWRRHLVLLSDSLSGALCDMGLSRVSDGAAGSAEAECIYQISAILRDTAYIPKVLFEHPDLAYLEAEIEEICAAGNVRDELEREILAVFSPEAVKLDAAGMALEWNRSEQSWFLKKLSVRKKIRKELLRAAADSREIPKDSVPVWLEKIREYQDKSGQVKAFETGALFGRIWNGGRPDWEALKQSYQTCTRLSALLARYAGSPKKISRAECGEGNSPEGVERGPSVVKRSFSDAVLSDYAAFRSMEAEKLSAFCEDYESVLSARGALERDVKLACADFEEAPDWIAAMHEAAERFLKNTDRLYEWSVYREAAGKAEAAGLAGVVNAYEGGLEPDRVLPAYYKALSSAYIDQIVDGEQALAGFHGTLFEEKIAQYKELCEAFEGLTRQEIAARLSAEIPQVSAGISQASEIGILLRAIRSGGRMQSIRKLFEAIPNLLGRLCPCMLMSPISVAQYIDPAYPPFDLVIFDEASQLPTSEAVGAIARGKDVIVVGDPKQLPPTSFFKEVREDEDNLEKEDLESILDDCMALSMPQEHLLWHYRSRHESLIAFSNIQYYDNRLYTFPSPNDRVTKVKLIPVEGVYDRGKTKQNRAEARAVVDEIIRRLSETGGTESIGVVTFSAVQQNLIEDLLMEEFGKHPELDEANHQSSEPVFIKNLENVQGDERDVILFSVGYGPDGNGRVALNFGPLNRDGGWRRLNVAVSRARKEMLVFSVLRPELIDESRTRADGVIGLKHFLEYAQRGKSALAVRAGNQAGIEDETGKIIAERIRGLGYQVDTDIGCSGYRIDIGIVDPDAPEEYLLGVMFDGYNYSSADTAKDRVVIRENLLRSLGWNLHRIWMLDWIESPEKELQKIGKAAGLAARKKKEASGNPKGPEGLKEAHEEDGLAENRENTEGQGKKEAAAAREADGCYAGAFPEFERVDKQETASADLLARPYKKCRIEQHGKGADAFCEPRWNSAILGQIKMVVNEEAPVSKQAVMRRLLEAWGIARMGSRLTRRFDELFELAGLTATTEGETQFFWKDGQEESGYTEYRSGDESLRRDMAEIPAVEIVNAVCAVLRVQLSLPGEELVKETYKLFGYSRGNAAIETRIAEAVEYGLEMGRIGNDAAGRIKEL